MQFLIKIIFSAVIIATVSELAKRFSLWAALLASLPLTSILAIIWLYRDTHDLQKVAALSMSIFWMVIPSVLFFIMLPMFIRGGFKFYSALIFSCAIMGVSYGVYTVLLRQIGIKF